MIKKHQFLAGPNPTQPMSKSDTDVPHEEAEIICEEYR